MAATSQDVSITYSSNSNKPKNKKKCTSLVNDSVKENDANNPPEKALKRHQSYQKSMTRRKRIDRYNSGGGIQRKE